MARQRAARPHGDAAPRSSLHGKVFGVGLARTGTTSLHEAMGILGLRSAPDSVALLDTIDEPFLARYDAFFDNPIPFRYRALDAVCPNSHYIVTHRPVDDWLASMRWLFGPGLDRLDPEMRTVGDRVHLAVYGTTQFEVSRFRSIHTEHYDAIAEWVRERSHVWLELDDGFSWTPICRLLDRPEPRVAFPVANRRRRRSRRR